ncbi:MAG: hypothetical protein WC435_00895 [Candidatus Paceibacterota bacterium]
MRTGKDVLMKTMNKIVLPPLSGEETLYSSGIFGERLCPIEWFRDEGLSHSSESTLETIVSMYKLNPNAGREVCFGEIFNFPSHLSVCFTQHQIAYLCKKETKPFCKERVIIRKNNNESSYFLLEGGVLLEIQPWDGHLRVYASKGYKNRKIEFDEPLYSCFFFPVDNILI